MGNIEEIAPKIWSVDDDDYICSDVDYENEDDAIVNNVKHFFLCQTFDQG